MPSKKRILLVNPYIEDFAAYDHFAKPFGLILLASFLKEHFELDFINVLNRLHPSIRGMRFKEGGTGNFQKKEIPKPECLKDIPRKFKRYGLEEEVFIRELENLPQKPDYIFVTSFMTYWYTGVQYTIKLLRGVFPEAKIFLGGIYASLLPEHASEYSGADFVIPGQETETVLAPLEDILNVRFDRALKAPSFELLGEYYYAPVMTSSGCVFHCSYCASRNLSPFRQYSPDFVADIIRALNRDFGVNNFAFYDDALLFQSERHIDVILNQLKSLKGMQFYTPNGLHIRYLTENTARLMKQTGFRDIRLSLESADPGFQNEKGAKADITEFLKALEILYSAGFDRKDIRVYTLLNVPGLEDHSVEETMKSVRKAGAVPMLAFYSPIPGTPDFKKAMRITDVSEPLFQNNSVYLYRSGFDIRYLNELKALELEYRREAGNDFTG